jgi:hypothetical protein
LILADGIAALRTERLQKVVIEAFEPPSQHVPVENTIGTFPSRTAAFSANFLSHIVAQCGKFFDAQRFQINDCHAVLKG